MRLALSIAVLLSLFAGLSARTVKDSVAAEVSSEEYTVYDAAINELFVDGKVTQDSGGKIDAKILVISDRTGSALPEAFGRDKDSANMMHASLETIADYRTKNQQPAMLKRSFKPKIEYVMFNVQTNAPEPNATLDPKQAGSWQTIGLSRVGFNNAHTEALVSVSYRCGGLCGAGFAFVVVKENGCWKVKQRSGLWEN
jgi:hypothetical protein